MITSTTLFGTHDRVLFHFSEVVEPEDPENGLYIRCDGSEILLWLTDEQLGRLALTIQEYRAQREAAKA